MLNDQEKRDANIIANAVARKIGVLYLIGSTAVRERAGSRTS